MSSHAEALERRLSKVRRRWKAVAALDGFLLAATEALGLFVLFVLTDTLYDLSGEVRAGMLSLGLVVLAVLVVRCVVRPLLRRIPDEQIALYIEERSPTAEGAVISALECIRERKSGLSGFIAGLLMGDAVQRLDQTNVRVFANLGRLKKHLLAACGLVAVFAITSLSFPQYARERGERIIAPWESVARAQKEAFLQEQSRMAQLRWLFRPIEIDVQPKGLAILRGKGIEFAVGLSRDPAGVPVFCYRSAAAGSKEQTIEMEKAQARFGYRLPFRDINEPFTYHVATAGHTSEKYEIKVYDPLTVRGLELTYRFPDYLQRDPLTTAGPSGDVTAIAGTRIDVRIIANNPLKSGALQFDDKTNVALICGAKAQDGATGAFTVSKDCSYNYEITDIYGERCKVQDFFFVKAVPDQPPTIALLSPKVDMSVHPLCEVTFAAKVADDFAIKDATVRLTYYRDGKPEAMALAMKPAGQNDFRNFLEGRAEHVLELEELSPAPSVGDMMFYYLEVADRKGQTAKTDVFFVKLMPFEVAASWPPNPSAPDLPHWDYLWTPDIILLAAAAWHIEQQRGKIPVSEFQSQCTQLAGRMEPAMNSQRGLNLLGGKAKLPKDIQQAAADLLALATGKLQKALELVRGYEPGQAALEMQQAMALAESVNTRKALQELELAQAPIHTGQPSGGYNQDAVQEQVEFRLPDVMSDSLTAFQQEDNPRHFLPPDYRRALRLKERTAPLTKELQLAGEIYASQEQLIEMAREAFGHLKLREAAEMSCTNDPAAGTGTKGEMIRVDKRAVPWTSMDPLANMPDIGNKGEMKAAKPEKIKGLAYPKLRDNERAGQASPHRSQTPGGGGEEDEDDQKPRAAKKKGYDVEKWKVLANDRRPQRNQGGGGGGDQQQQQSQPGMEQSQQQSGGGSSPSQANEAQQLAARQAALADRAAQLARGVSTSAKPDDTMAQQAAGSLREASREMRQATESFQRGDIRTGIAQARRAQQAMQSAMHGMRAAQFGTLEQALAAAQEGSASLVQNQYRVSQGTRQVEERIRELSGEMPGSSQAGAGGMRQGQAGKTQPGVAQSARLRSEGQPGDVAQSSGLRRSNPGGLLHKAAEPAQAQPGKGTPGKGEPGKSQPGVGQPSEGQSGEGQPGRQEPGKGQPGKGGEPGKGQNAQGPSQAAVEKAKGFDPRIAAGIKSLAGEQLQLSEAVKDFDAYSADLVKWSKETDKDRVTTSLKDAADGLKQDGVAQKMVDAGVDLSQENIGSARTAQGEIEAGLEKMNSRLREAGDILAGSQTGIIGRAARQAKEIGEKVRELAGLPQPGSAGVPAGEAGQNQPSQGQAGRGQPAEGQPPQGQGAQGQPSPSQPGVAQSSGLRRSNPGGLLHGQTGQPSQGQPGLGQPPQGQPVRPGERQPQRGEETLADRLSAEEKGQAAGAAAGAVPQSSRIAAGNPEGLPDTQIDALWLKTRDLADTLRDEQLAPAAALDYLSRRVEDQGTFRQMFEKVKQAEAGKFAAVVTGIGKSLDEVLKETLSAKKLHSEQREESPPKFRSFIDAYFESLSKAATGK